MRLHGERITQPSEAQIPSISLAFQREMAILERQIESAFPNFDQTSFQTPISELLIKSLQELTQRFPDTEIPQSIADLQRFFAGKRVLVVGGHEGLLFAQLGTAEVVMVDPAFYALSKIPERCTVCPFDFLEIYRELGTFDIVYSHRMMDTGNPIQSVYLPSDEQLLACLLSCVNDTGTLLCSESYSAVHAARSAVSKNSHVELETLHGDRITAASEIVPTAVSYCTTPFLFMQKRETVRNTETGVDSTGYLRKRIYYLYPFVRKMYIAFFNSENSLQLKIRWGAVTTFEETLKELLTYYARVWEKPEKLDWDRENTIVSRLVYLASWALDAHPGTDPLAHLQNTLSQVSELTINKSDGKYHDHQFGGLSAEEFAGANLPSSSTRGVPDYSMGASGGFLQFDNEFSKRIIDNLTEHIAQKREGRPIIIWGNITRGIFDAALIHTALLEKGIPAALCFYRYSSHATFDKECQLATIPPSWTDEAWNIAVDSMTAGGKSVTGTEKLLRSFGGKSSMFLTFCGYDNWQGKYPIEFCHNPRCDQGTLLSFD